MEEKPSPPRPGESLSDLQAAASERLEDAEALLKSGRYVSAIAFGLYALEIELKVVICRHLDITKLPRIHHHHKLEELLIHSGLSNKIRRTRRPRFLGKNWDDLVRIAGSVDQFRYRYDPTWDDAKAGRVLQLLRDPPNGVLLWLQKQASLRGR